MEDSSHYMPLKIINQSSLPEKSHTNKKLLGTGPKLKRRGKTKKKTKKETPDKSRKDKGTRISHLAR